MAFENLKSTGIAYVLTKLKGYFLQIKDAVKSVNGNLPNENGNITIRTVPFAQNLESELSQSDVDAFVLRPAGGGKSIEDGGAWLMDIKGNNVHDDYSPEIIEMTINRAEGSNIDASYDRDTFVSYVGSSGTYTIVYASSWSVDPALYGITVEGNPVAGDSIVMNYTAEVRGTITVANPQSLVATGWNLYNNTFGYARVAKYDYGYRISGEYTALQYSATLTGTRTSIEVSDGNFDIPAHGYVWVTGGNSSSTAIWLTHTDWTESYEGNFQPYSQTVVDLSGVMSERFPNGLMKAGSVVDEINLNLGTATIRVERLEYNAENLAGAESSGREYEYDQDYIYLAMALPETYSVEIDGSFTANDHGLEWLMDTDVPVTTELLYGNNLKNKLERDVLTISQQTLTDAQQKQVRLNIGVGKYDESISNLNITEAGEYYYTANSTNAPGAAAGRLDVIKAQGSAYGTQIATPNSNSPVMYIRSITPNVTGGFSTWTPVITESGNRDAFLYDNTASTTHVVHFPNNSRNLLISCGTGATTNIEIFIYCASNGTITYDEINKGGNVSYAVSTNTVTLTVGSAMGMTHRTVNVYGGKAYL